MRSGMRSSDWVCQSWTAIDRTAAGESAPSHHVQVKSGVECQIGTVGRGIRGGREVGVESHFETDLEDSDLVCEVVL